MSDTLIKTDNEQVQGIQLAGDVLAESGWDFAAVGAIQDGKVRLFYAAFHENYPTQRSWDLAELIRRCWWQEDNRTVAQDA